VRRLPITELGCHAGAAALVHAHDYLIGHPGANVLVVSVELPTLSFQGKDASIPNIVSTAIFGDGAAAALVTGGAAPGAEVLGTRSWIFPRSIDALGFDLREDGFHVVLGRELPTMLKSELGGIVDGLLGPAGLRRQDLTSFVLHPGGRRILEAIQDELGFAAEACAPSWDVLRDYGNLSSATVLFVLDEWLHRRRPPAGSHGLVAAFGPGFSTELLLLRWN
jgi:alkylresorcinol/alkylpyrone synthase